MKIWSPRERRCAEDAVTHAGRRGVKALRWSADGNETPRNFLLASGDATGLVAFWTVDRRARPEKIAELSPERAFPFGEFLSAKAAGESGAFRVTHLLAAPCDAKTDADGEKNAPGSNLSSFRFLVGYARFGEGGSAMCAVDIRHVPHPDTEIVSEGPKSLPPKPITVASAVLFQSEAPFAAALLRRSRGTDSESMPRTFAAVTLDLNSTLRCHAPPSPDWRAEDYQTTRKSKSKGVQSEEGCWTETLKFKLPVEGVTSEGLVWAREGVLAAVSDKDPSGAVRMFDLDSGANYSLRAWDSEHVSGGDDKTRLVTSQDSSRDPASRRLTCVARDDATGAIGVGSRDGRVAVFRRVGGFDEDERRRTGTTRDTDKQTTKSSDASRRAGSSRRSRRRDVARDDEATSDEATSDASSDADDANDAFSARTSSNDDDRDERAWRRSATTRLVSSSATSHVVALRFASKSSRVLSALVADDKEGAFSKSRTAHDKQKRDGGVSVFGDGGGEENGKSACWKSVLCLSAHVLANVRLADKVRDGVSLAHLAGDELVVESAVGLFPPRAFQSGKSANGQILGADVAGDFLLIWTNRHAELHVFGRDGFERVGRFPHHPPSVGGERALGDATEKTTSPTRYSSTQVSRAYVGAQTLALGARGACVFRPGRGAGVVEACEPGGAPRDALTYDKAHGAVACMDVNDSGAFLSVATLGGRVHSWWLGGRSPARRGGTNPAVVPHHIDAPIESVKTNADGSLVLVSFGLEPSGSSHVGVYDVARDFWASFDFARGVGRAVETIAWDCSFPSLFCTQTARLETHKSATRISTTLTSADVDARFREDRDRAGLVAFTCFAARAESLEANSGAAGKEKTRSSHEDVALFVAPQESHVIPDGFDAVLGVAAPVLFVSQKANARSDAASRDRSAPTRGACFSVCMRDFEGVDVVDAESDKTRTSHEDERGDITASLLAFHEALARDDTSRALLLKSTNDEKVRKTITEAFDERSKDRAFRAAKALTHPAAWACASRACVRRKRLDVAELCLSHMGHVRGARAARDAARFAEPDARVAAVATHLGLTEDAERLYKDCGRFDLLAALLRSAGRWRDALRVVDAHDRVHLKSTHFAHARHLESLGDVANAVRAYEKSGRAHREVPRLLRARGELNALDAYVAQSSSQTDSFTSQKLRLWRAKVLESEGDAEGALEEYLACGAFLDATRALCAAGDLAGAEQTVRRAEEEAAAERGGSSSLMKEERKSASGFFSGPSREHVFAASAFHLARAFEARDSIADAIAWFGKAGRHGHALRLAMRHGMDGEVARLSGVAPETSAAETARFFLRRGDVARAATLFAKAGSLGKAAELCFEHDMHEPLSEIVLPRLLEESRDGADGAEASSERSRLLRRCATWFTERGRFEHAVLLEIRAGNHDAALRLALEKDVAVDEKMADALVGAEDEENAKDASFGSSRKKAALLDVARLCKRQGNYSLSCKLYAKAGERSKAMKALLKTGDAEKVIFFAGVSRDRDAYVMAANFLQTLDWRAERDGSGATNDDEKKKKTDGKTDVAKHIVLFYQKAKAYGHLAGFYESCAASEIDEFRDYDAALVALREARRCRAKALAKTETKADLGEGGVASQKERLAAEKAHLSYVDAAVDAVTRFCDARVLLSSDPERARVAIRHLADDMAKETNSSVMSASVATVRAGDAYAMLVEHFFGVARDAKTAHGYLVSMRERGIQIGPYIDADMLREISRECGKETPE